MKIANCKSVAVLGAGSWGTALAIRLALNGHPTRLWGRDPGRVQEMAAERYNRRYLPDTQFPERLTPEADLTRALKDVAAILVAVPSHGYRELLECLASQIPTRLPVFWASKGLESGSRKFLHQVTEEVLGNERPTGVVSGPTFAGEVARGLPTAVTVAGCSMEAAQLLASYLHSHTFRTYTSTDVVGVELGGASKNVLAIAAGVADGLGYGANTRAALITRGLAEMMRLGAAVGGSPETFMGLAGMGDLVLTCTDNQSRNRRLGLALGQGLMLESALAEIGQAVEGVKSAPEMLHLARDHAVEMPITEQVCRLVEGDTNPQQAVEALLSREPKTEGG
ncbi:NAD(P)H-dependent glycerol-3-phosphate dehydrogenase [Thiohalomonas denitrificans]|uniref:NAD(P)H-dependent glycerol-3-phosphate dehydrogenase n=1 Tax=Thiohalomonas denitrificans TaxID=415747 RepID=UPI0026F13A47|nr:NAD(P)H-dependent glycerol-3-phosphate dehydrogenase [Thiohalomonas denitrificans]